MNPGTLIALAIVTVAIVYYAVPAFQRVSYKVWIYAGLLKLIILFGMFLPAPLVVKILPVRDGQPFESGLALLILSVISIALVIAALLINSGLHLYRKMKNGEGEEDDIPYRPKYLAKPILIVLVLSVLLLAKALHSFYWLMVWDSTYDPLGVLWLPIPALAVIFSSFLLFFVLPGRIKPAGFLYLLLTPALLSIVKLTQLVNFRQITENRVERVSQVIETYYSRVGRYPEDIQELRPLYLLTLPEPLILFGESWCYDGGPDYYRLGYLDRDHWSSPNLIGQIYKTKGDVPNSQRICEAEAAILMERYPHSFLTFDESDELVIKGE